MTSFIAGGSGCSTQRHPAVPAASSVSTIALIRHLEDSRRGLIRMAIIEHLTILRMDHVGIVVNDLAEAVAFFVELGLELEGEATLEGRSVDRVVGLEGVRSDVAMMRTPDGHGYIELSKFHTPSGRGGDPRAPANALGIRHVTFAVEGIDDVLDRLRTHGAELVGELERYEDSYRLCYVRGPEGIIIELAERIG